MANDWKSYQEEAADFFRSIGLKASTDVKMKGARGVHDVDVLVEIVLGGLSVKWIIECKHWKRRVHKLHVIALKEIVADLGVDRGIILCEVGFQSGALEAANLTNVQATSLSGLSTTSQDAVASVKLRDLFDRTADCRSRYWDIPKEVRIETGLRPDLGDTPIYSGNFVIEVVEKYLGLAFRGAFPIDVDRFDIIKLGRKMPETLENSYDTLVALEPLIAELEHKIQFAEAHMNAPE